MKCLNCSFSNGKFITNYDTSHSTTDYNKCEIYKAKIKKNIEMTIRLGNHLTPPIIPTYTDKVEKTLTKSNQRFSMNTASNAHSAKIISSPSTITLSDAHIFNNPNMIQLIRLGTNEHGSAHQRWRYLQKRNKF